MTARATAWPVAIVGALAVTVGANVYLLYRATDTAVPLEADYYRKALAWDSTMAQASRNQALGWRLTGDLAVDGGLVARVTDRDGQPIAGATVRVEGFPVAFADGGVAATLGPVGTSYGGSVPLRHQGLHEFRFEVVAHGDRFTAVLRGTPGFPLVNKP